VNTAEMRLARKARAENMVVPAVLLGATVVASAITGIANVYSERPGREPGPALAAATRATLDTLEDTTAAVRDGHFAERRQRLPRPR
jgi:hypothetical protein